MQNLEVSGAVRHIRVYVVRQLRVKEFGHHKLYICVCVCSCNYFFLFRLKNPYITVLENECFFSLYKMGHEKVARVRRLD